MANFVWSRTIQFMTVIELFVGLLLIDWKHGITFCRSELSLVDRASDRKKILCVLFRFDGMGKAPRQLLKISISR